MEKETPKGAKGFLEVLGPGLVTGASDDDPSGIATYAMTGAQLGYAPLWTALLTFPMMAAIQFICAKIGMVSGQGIARVLRKHYWRILLYPVVLALILANTLNAGADILAIAEGIHLLVPVPVATMIAPIGIGILVFQIWGSYRLLARIFKWLALTLVAFIASAFFARPDWMQVLRGTFVPEIRTDSVFLATLVAILGTTISPYLFFWQASQEVEEDISRGKKKLWQRKGATNDELQYAFWDVAVGMLASNAVMYFIILSSAATLHQAGKTNITSAAQAAEALRPLAGNAATLLMAIGLIGTGILAVPILTGSAAYAVCDTFGWTCSLDAKPSRAKEFYIVVSLSTLGALVVSLIGIPAMDALFWTAVINGFLAPPLLVVVMLIANNRQIMGKRVNGLWENLLGWATTAMMFAAAIALVWTWGQA
jgi:NRAMP (natural resistance-associated macrophage protein)-like metal ion transporter